jgi:hypothetical protein
MATIATAACPEGVCHGNTGVSVASDPATGFYSATLISGTYSLRVHADGYQPTLRSVTVDRDQTQDFALTPQSCVLLVDDDAGDSVETLYESDLEALGVDYTIWSVASHGTPSLELLEAHQHALWVTGQRYYGTLTSADQTVLSQYLDGGGNLLLSSWGVGGDLDGDPFLSDFLHADYQDDVYGGDISLSGAGFLASYPLTITTLPGQQVSKLTPLGGAIAVYDLPAPHDSPAAIAYDGDYGMVYLGFGLETVSDEASRRAALQAVVDWLGPCAVAAPTPSFVSSSPDVVGSTTLFINTTVGVQPITYTWELGDGSPDVVQPGDALTLTHVYTQVGSYTVWLTASNPGGSVAFSDTVEIIGTPPVAGFVYAAPVVVGSPVLFTNTTAPGQPAQTDYTWSFGDGVGSSTAEHPTYSYTQVGTYTVSLTAANLAGSDVFSATLQATAAAPPEFRLYLPLIVK